MTLCQILPGGRVDKYHSLVLFVTLTATVKASEAAELYFMYYQNIARLLTHTNITEENSHRYFLLHDVPMLAFFRLNPRESLIVFVFF